MKHILIAIITVLLTECRTAEYEYWPISKFNIDQDALKDNEEIKLLYTSRGGGSPKEEKYFIHAVVVSQKSGDTVNVLSPLNIGGFTLDDADKVFKFISPNNEIAKTMFKSNEDLGGTGSNGELNLKDFNKVVRDPKFDIIGDNKYPSVIGLILTPP